MKVVSGADERRVAAVVFRDHGPGEVERRAGDVRVNVNAARKNDHARRIDGAIRLERRYDLAIADVEVADDTVDAIGRVVNFAARDSERVG
jgi:hypothetical protein